MSAHSPKAHRTRDVREHKLAGPIRANVDRTSSSCEQRPRHDPEEDDAHEDPNGPKHTRERTDRFNFGPRLGASGVEAERVSASGEQETGRMLVLESEASTDVVCILRAMVARGSPRPPDEPRRHHRTPYAKQRDVSQHRLRVTNG